MARHQKAEERSECVGGWGRGWRGRKAPCRGCRVVGWRRMLRRGAGWGVGVGGEWVWGGGWLGMALVLDSEGEGLCGSALGGFSVGEGGVAAARGGVLGGEGDE